MDAKVALATALPPSKTVTADELDLIKRTVANGASDAELKLYLFDCQRQGVHPLDKLLHFTTRKDKNGVKHYTPVTSIDLMRIRAAETNEYAGSDDAVFSYTAHGEKDGPNPDDARVTVWRLVQGQRCAFTATARWAEYSVDGPMWKKMPCTMLAKCAEALALRKGFPRQLAGLYASEELDQAEKPAPIRIPPQRELDGEPPRTEDEQNVYAPSGLSAEDLPGAQVYLTKVAPGMGKAKAFVWTSAQPASADGIPIYKQEEDARAWCFTGTPVLVAVKESASGRTYIAKIDAVKPEPVIQMRGDVDDDKDPLPF